MRGRVLAVLVVVLGGCAARPLPPAAPAFRAVPIGLCEDYPEESTSWEQVRADLALLRAAGIRDLRVSFGWDSIEPADDRFDWTFWDEFVRLAVDEHGIRLRPYLAYTPAWAAAPGEGEVWTRPPADPRQFAEFVTAVAGRYGDRIDSWELWNEPDNPSYWTGTIAQFAALLHGGAAAVRAADPGATVVLGGIAWNVEFLATLFAAYDAAAAVDVVNVHSYAETWSNDPLESVVPYIARVAAAIAAGGGDEPIWAAEVGYGSYRAGARVSFDYMARYAYEHTADYQAVALVRMLALLLSTGRVSLIAWYEMRDLPPAADVIGDNNNRHLGVLAVDGTPKPALAALMFMRALFHAPMRPLGSELAVARAPDATSVVLGFERDDGAFIVTAWLPTHDPADPAPRDGQAIDERSETVTVTLPRSRQAVTLYDELGRVRAVVPATGRTVPLALYGGKVAIAVAW